jgi:diguanylate cyclase (GGDEF)-like protein
MGSKGGLRQLWEKGHAPSPARTIALVGMVGGLCCVLAATFPATDAAPVGTLRVAGAATLVGSLAVWLFGDRMPRWGLHLAVAVSSAGIAVVVSQSASALDMFVAAGAYLWICVYAGFFFSLPAVRAHMAWIAVTFGAAILIAEPYVPLNAWAFLILSLFVAGETLGRQSARLRLEAHTDALTGLLNRNGLAMEAKRAFALADRTGIPLTAALVDLDNFKQVNDDEGHMAGDRALVELAAVWGGELEPSDIFARLGGDEFLLILVGSSREETAHLFERLSFVSPAPWSAGVVRRQPGEDLGSCMANADRALYEAKGEHGSRWTDYRVNPDAGAPVSITSPRSRRRFARLMRRASAASRSASGF